jgi:hypothetical protein
MKALLTKAELSTEPDDAVHDLLELLGTGPEASVARVASAFREFQKALDALPLPSEEFCFAHNWLNSAQKLWEGGDRPTAYYQLKLLVKKLAL